METTKADRFLDWEVDKKGLAGKERGVSECVCPGVHSRSGRGNLDRFHVGKKWKEASIVRVPSSLLFMGKDLSLGPSDHYLTSLSLCFLCKRRRLLMSTVVGITANKSKRLVQCL